jgi:hypothetical protein
MHNMTVQIHGGEYTPSQPPHPAMSIYHTHPRSTHTTYIADRNTRQLHGGQACAAPPAVRVTTTPSLPPLQQLPIP